MPIDAVPVIIRVVSGKGNYISNNHIVAITAASETGSESDTCFSMQVEALLSAKESDALTVTAVLIEPKSSQNVVLDFGSELQVIMDKAVNAFRATPAP